MGAPCQWRYLNSEVNDGAVQKNKPNTSFLTWGAKS
jgi:hypothetical protein